MFYDTIRCLNRQEGLIEISELMEESHTTAKEKGWWDEPRTFAECIALIHSEASEGLEEWRNGEDEIYFVKDKYGNDKPEGIAVELADILIRVGDVSMHFGYELVRALELKLAYNKTRPHRHGGKRA